MKKAAMCRYGGIRRCDANHMKRGRDEGVLGDTVDKWHTFQNGGNCKGSRRQHLTVGGTNRGKDDVAVAFHVSSPEHDYTIQTVLFFEPPHIGLNVIEMSLCPSQLSSCLPRLFDWPR